MPDPTDASSAELEDCRRSAGVLSDWIADNTELLLGVYALRGLGEQAAEALDAVMKVRQLNHTRLSWELWETLANSRGIDTNALLEERVPRHLVQLALVALRDDATAVFDRDALRRALSSDPARGRLVAIQGGGEGAQTGAFVRARLRGPKRSS